MATALRNGPGGWLLLHGRRSSAPGAAGSGRVVAAPTAPVRADVPDEVAGVGWLRRAVVSGRVVRARAARRRPGARLQAEPPHARGRRDGASSSTLAVPRHGTGALSVREGASVLFAVCRGRPAPRHGVGRRPRATTHQRVRRRRQQQQQQQQQQQFELQCGAPGPWRWRQCGSRRRGRVAGARRPQCRRRGVNDDAQPCGGQAWPGLSARPRRAPPPSLPACHHRPPGGRVPCRLGRRRRGRHTATPTPAKLKAKRRGPRRSSL